MSDIRKWLEELGLRQLADAFETEQFDLQAVRYLDDQALEKLGVPMGPRLKILAAIEVLKAQPTNESEAESRLGETGPVREAERRQITVMFCDLVGSTALSAKLDPEELREQMQAYRKACSDVIGRYDGHVAQYLGDGVMVYFGWPTAHEDDAQRTVRAGLDIVDAVAGLEASERMEVRMGIATGLVVVGESGADEGADAKLAVGETPNIAARVQGLAEPGTVAIAHSTKRLLGGAFALDDLGTHDAKGVSGGLKVHRVLGVADTESRFEASHGAALTPLVGRESEISALLDRWELAKTGEGQVVLLSGEPGIGKSRLNDSLRERIADEPHTRLRYQCSPYHSNSAFYPFVDQIGRAAQFGRTESTDDKVGKLLALLALATDDPDSALAALASLMMVDHHIADDVTALSPGERKERIAEALLGQLAGLAGKRPVLMTFEDIQWIDPSSLDILDMIVERLPTLRVLAIFSFRLAFEPTWIGRPHVNVMVLNRLSGRLAIDMVAHLAGDADLTAAEQAEIVDKTDGIPLFVEELTRTILETRGGNGSTIPVTLRDALTARLDALGQASEVAQTAAAIGREFTEDVLLAVSDLPANEVRAAIDRLVASQLIDRRGTAAPAHYSFRQALVQDVAYESLLRDRRRRIHHAISNHLEQEYAEIAINQPETLARHLSEAADWPRAADYWLRAAEIAKARFANVEAAEHLDAGLIADQQDPTKHPERRATMMTVYGDLESRAGNLDAANAWYDKALALVNGAAARHAIENHRHRPRRAVRAGAGLAFYEHGAGEETLLFVNPAVYGLATFQPILEELCDAFRIITVDCRGTGASDPLIRPFPVSEHVEDLVAILGELGPGSITGVGISRGCSHLIRLSVTRPDLLSKLVLVGGSVASLTPDPQYGPPEDFVEKLRVARKQGDMEGALRAHVAQVFTEPGTRHVAEQFLKNNLNLPRETVLNFYEPDPEIDVRPLLPDVTIPTLIMHGTEDHLLPFAGAEYLAANIGGAELYAFEGKGHLPLFTATAEFCSTLRAFVTGGDLDR